jgi:Flp pilus assembly protein TadG
MRAGAAAAGFAVVAPVLISAVTRRSPRSEAEPASSAIAAGEMRAGAAAAGFAVVAPVLISAVYKAVAAERSGAGQLSGYKAITGQLS